MTARGSGLGGDLAVGAALAVLLGGAWSLRDWTALHALALPDGDDVMRLQQVRDWLAGQRWGDLAQHRLGNGVAMHWSRLADLGPAALISALMPIVGRHSAEVAAVIVWPIALFAAALGLVARIARAAGNPAGERVRAHTAAVVAALAFPAITVFVPGRIDHHGLQVVLLLAATLAALGPATARRGLAGGIAAAASMVVGLETAPLLVALAACAMAEAVADGRTARRLAGLGAGLSGGLLAGRLAFASDAFAYAACDGFTLDAWRAGLAGGAAALVVAVAAARIRSASGRALAALVAGGSAALVAVAAAPRCLVPYGGLDPRLVRLWLGRVEEAQPLLAASGATAIGFAGLLVAGIAAAAWRLRAERTWSWAVLLALQLAALAVTAAQLRGAYAGAMLAAPALAAAIERCRRRGTVALVAAWAGSTGLLYPIAADAAVGGGGAPARAPAADCTAPAVRRLVATLPPGTMIAPVDDGARLIADTGVRVVAAPYHRDGAGILASFDFFDGSPAAAWSVARRWRVRYVLLCDADLAVLAPPRGSTARALAAGRAPGWLRPIAAPGGVHLFEVRAAADGADAGPRR